MLFKNNSEDSCLFILLVKIKYNLSDAGVKTQLIKFLSCKPEDLNLLPKNDEKYIERHGDKMLVFPLLGR